MTALVAAGYQVYVINPLAASVSGSPQRRRREVRCRRREDARRSGSHGSLSAPSVRRGHSEAEAIRVMARGHQYLIWTRTRRHCCVVGSRSGGEGVEMRFRRRVALSNQLSSAFTGFRFPPEVIMLAVRWYLRFGLSYRDLEELLALSQRRQTPGSLRPAQALSTLIPPCETRPMKTQQTRRTPRGTRRRGGPRHVVSLGATVHANAHRRGTNMPPRRQQTLVRG